MGNPNFIVLSITIFMITCTHNLKTYISATIKLDRAKLQPLDTEENNTSLPCLVAIYL